MAQGYSWSLAAGVDWQLFLADACVDNQQYSGNTPLTRIRSGSGKGNLKITHSTHPGSYWDIPLSSVNKERKIMLLKCTTYELVWIVMPLLRPHRSTALIAAELNHWHCCSQWNQLTKWWLSERSKAGLHLLLERKPNRRTVSAWCGTDTLLPKILNTNWHE